MVCYYNFETVILSYDLNWSNAPSRNLWLISYIGLSPGSQRLNQFGGKNEIPFQSSEGTKNLLQHIFYHHISKAKVLLRNYWLEICIITVRLKCFRASFISLLKPLCIPIISDWKNSSLYRVLFFNCNLQILQFQIE